MERLYWFDSTAPRLDYMWDFLQVALEEKGRLVHYEAIEHPKMRGFFHHRFVVDWYGVSEWLDDKVRRIVGGTSGTEGWSVIRINGFVDFAFEPLVSPDVEIAAAKHPKLLYEFCTRELYEHCEIRGDERYGAIGEYWDTFRFYAGPIDMNSDENPLFDVEDSLEVCVNRISRYVRTGEGESVNIHKYFNQRPKS